MASAVRFRVRLTPRAGADRIDSVIDGVLGAAVAAPPVRGAANDALRRVIARELDVPPSAIRIASGERGRSKVLVVSGVERAEVVARWPGLDVRLARAG